MTMTRKQFLKTLAGTGVGLLGASLLMACGSDDEEDMEPGGANCVANGTTVSIGSNHGHTLVVAKADVSAGVNKTYDIAGTSGHPHSVTITAAQFATLAANSSVSVVSTTGAGHTHDVTVVCA
jgi:large exoprotein involved in heme utilization and adhesion